jgi:uncharacterized membrane protein YesL
MSFLKPDYSKPGAGVSKDEGPQKRWILQYFESLWAHLGRLVMVNAIFLLFCVPAVALMAIINLSLQNNMPSPVIMNFLSFLPLSLLAIPIGGLTYVTRNMARDEHAFLWYDFVKNMTKNWKQNLIHGLLTFAVTFCCAYAILFYADKSHTNWLYFIPCAFVVVVIVAFLFAQFYIPTMIVTFDLSYKNILRNGFSFAIMGFMRNFWLAIVCGLIWIGILGYLVDSTGETIGMGLLGLILGFPAVTSFTVNFFAYPLLVEYMIKPQYENGEEDNNGPREGDFYKPLENADEEPEYVFINGRLVRRTESEQVFTDDV